MKILYIPLDFQEWSKARHLTYCFSLGFEEGFRANRMEFVTIPTLCKDSSGMGQSTDSDVWLSKARSLCKGMQFDQVWVEAVHNPLSEDILQWIAEAAPIRVAMVGESLEYDPEVKALHPHLMRRKLNVEKRLRYFTHGLVVDEVDAKDLASRGIIKTFWYPSAVPEKFLAWDTVATPEKRANFSGAVYGKRGGFLEDERFKGVFSQLPSPEAENGIAAQFDSLQNEFLTLIHSGKSIGWNHVSAYLRLLRAIRSESFRLWIRHLSRGSAVVNLPSYFQGYAGRVAEGISAGRPVISWDVQNRPRNKALFEVGTEILLYHEDDRDALYAHIEKVLGDPLYAQAIAGRALRRVWRFHTMEKRIAQILAWMQSGVEPNFSEVNPVETIPQAITAFEDCLAGRKTEVVIADGSSQDLSQLEHKSEQNPNDLKIHLALGALYLENCDYQKAARSYLNAIKLGQNDVETWLACARAGLGGGNAVVARLALDGALRLEPYSQNARELSVNLRVLQSS